jgi:hypothetical protein
MLRFVWVLAALLVGCYTTPIVTDKQQGSTSRGLVLAVTVEPLVLERGGTLHVRLTVTNESDVAVVKGFASGCIYGFAVRDRNGDRVGPPPRFCTMDAPTVTYGPGEVAISEFQWTWDDSNIAPGDYYVEAGFGESGEGGAAVEIRLR